MHRITQLHTQLILSKLKIFPSLRDCNIFYLFQKIWKIYCQFLYLCAFSCASWAGTAGRRTCRTPRTAIGPSRRALLWWGCCSPDDRPPARGSTRRTPRMWTRTRPPRRRDFEGSRRWSDGGPTAPLTGPREILQIFFFFCSIKKLLFIHNPWLYIIITNKINFTIKKKKTSFNYIREEED